MNKAVTLFRDVKIDGKWTSVKAEAPFRDLKEGKYRLRWFVGRKATYLTVGRQADVARAKLAQKIAELAAAAKGVQVVGLQSRTNVESAIATYLFNVRLLVGNDGFGRSERTHKAYKYRLDQFQKFLKQETKSIEYVDEITDALVQKFATYLQHEGYGDRSVFNIVQALNSFLLKNENTAAKWLSSNLSFHQGLPKVYTVQEEKKFFSICDEEEALWSGFFRWSGGREQEVVHAQAQDILEKNGQVFVHFRHKNGFRLKGKKRDNAGRMVPLHPKYGRSLLTYIHEAKLKPSDLLFSNENGTIEGHFLRKTKQLAELAGLDPKGFTLHSWRRTWATRMHEAGVSPRTIQYRLGHNDLKTTLRYLGVSGDDSISEAEQHAFQSMEVYG